MPDLKMAFVAADSEAAQKALAALTARYRPVDPAEADVVVALGGDGLMLETLHRFMGDGKPIFGMHRGSVGFLMNSYRLDGLPDRIARAKPVELNPLEMRAETIRGEVRHARAINE